jgi:hypothetical protein
MGQRFTDYGGFGGIIRRIQDDERRKKAAASAPVAREQAAVEGGTAAVAGVTDPAAARPRSLLSLDYDGARRGGDLGAR